MVYIHIIMDVHRVGISVRFETMVPATSLQGASFCYLLVKTDRGTGGPVSVYRGTPMVSCATHVVSYVNMCMCCVASFAYLVGACGVFIMPYVAAGAVG